MHRAKLPFNPWGKKKELAFKGIILNNHLELTNNFQPENIIYLKAWNIFCIHFQNIQTQNYSPTYTQKKPYMVNGDSSLQKFKSPPFHGLHLNLY